MASWAAEVGVVVCLHEMLPHEPLSLASWDTFFLLAHPHVRTKTFILIWNRPEIHVLAKVESSFDLSLCHLGTWGCTWDPGLKTLRALGSVTVLLLPEPQEVGSALGAAFAGHFQGAGPCEHIWKVDAVNPQSC